MGKRAPVTDLGEWPGRARRPAGLLGQRGRSERGSGNVRGGGSGGAVPRGSERSAPDGLVGASGVVGTG